MIGRAVNEHWKLKAIDSLETSLNAEEGLSDAERKKILESLIGNQEIREIILPKEKSIIKNHNTELTKER